MSRKTQRYSKEFKAEAVRTVLENQLTSMSRKGNCYDNAPMESFWGTLKNESLSHYRFNNRDEAISVIREYIEIFYNRQRRHSRLGNISPAAFREKYHQMAA
ncbi:putative transposase [Shigella flexneri K-1770]|nr:putative transposase [Shigella flexneri VA-6]EIQ13093.1 putative transposase [Shigella flexneri K-1770]SRN40583.1 IS600 ORF2 [Shigella flexneri]